jgi:tetratricopeptide (TPR) repeat protein
MLFTQKNKRFTMVLIAIAFIVVVAIRYRFDAIERSLPPVLSDPRVVSLAEQAKQQQMAVNRTPKDVTLRWKLADTFQKLGAIVPAQTQLREIARLEPKETSARIALANTHLALEQWDEAAKVYQSVARDQPRNAEAWAGYAICLYHQKRYAEAIQPARKSVHLQPEEPNHHFVIANCYLEYGEQYARRFHYANPLFRSAYFKSTIKHLNRVIATWPDQGNIYYAMGRAYIGLRDKKSAIKYLRRARELMPQHKKSAVLLAQVYKGTGRNQAAQQITEQLLRQFPNDAELQGLYGHILQESSATDAMQRALEAFRKAAQLDPENSLRHQQFGSVALQLGQTEVAKEAFEYSIRLNTHDSFPYQRLSTLYSREGKSQLAAKFAKRSREMLFNQQQQEKIEHLSERHPQDVSLHLILADRYASLNQNEIARNEYLAALQIDPTNRRAKAGVDALTKSLLTQGSREKTGN